MSVFQAKGKIHLRYIRDRAWELWKESGWQSGAKDDFLRQALREHVETLQKEGSIPNPQLTPPLRKPRCVICRSELSQGEIFHHILYCIRCWRKHNMGGYDGRGTE